MGIHTIEQQYSSALDQCYKEYGHGFFSRVSEDLDEVLKISPSHLSELKNGNRSMPEEKRRAILRSVNRVIGSSFEYQEFLDFGHLLLLGDTPETARMKLKALHPKNPTSRSSGIAWGSAAPPALTAGPAEPPNALEITLVPVVGRVRAGTPNEAIEETGEVVPVHGVPAFAWSYPLQ